jgi:YfiH family protein
MSPPDVLRSKLLAGLAGIDHAFFTRRGGVSGGLYESLNVGLGSRDDPARVRENRRRAAASLGAEASRLVTAFQVHSARTITVEGPFPGEPPEADALVTATPGLMLGALAADCAPILIAHGDARIIAAVHAGWKGALGGVVASAVEAMVALGAARGGLVAAVGPCIGPASYEVGIEFMARFVAASEHFQRFFAAGPQPEKRRFDLPGFVLDRLAAAGINEAEWIGADTCAQAGDFYSHRRMNLLGESDYGRGLSAIIIRP